MFLCVTEEHVRWSGDEHENAEDDSDDDAPEDVSNSKMKNSVLSQVKAAMDKINKEKQSKKLKRKNREEVFTAQKVGKLKIKIDIIRGDRGEMGQG